MTERRVRVRIYVDLHGRFDSIGMDEVSVRLEEAVADKPTALSYRLQISRCVITGALLSASRVRDFSATFSSRTRTRQLCVMRGR